MSYGRIFVGGALFIVTFSWWWPIYTPPHCGCLPPDGTMKSVWLPLLALHCSATHICITEYSNSSYCTQDNVVIRNGFNYLMKHLIYCTRKLGVPFCFLEYELFSGVHLSITLIILVIYSTSVTIECYKDRLL